MPDIETVTKERDAALADALRARQQLVAQRTQLESVLAIRDGQYTSLLERYLATLERTVAILEARAS